MKKAVLLGVASLFAFGLLAVAGSESALAIPPFFKEFESMYVEKDSPLAAEVARVKKCNVCHKGTDKKMRNAYGEALDKLLDKKTDAGDAEKIKKALEEVGAMHIDAEDDESPTYADRLKEGKLPTDEE
jgi:hypothetical protein